MSSPSPSPSPAAALPDVDLVPQGALRLAVSSALMKQQHPASTVSANSSVRVMEGAAGGELLVWSVGEDGELYAAEEGGANRLLRMLPAFPDYTACLCFDSIQDASGRSTVAVALRRKDNKKCDVFTAWQVPAASIGQWMATDAAGAAAAQAALKRDFTKLPGVPEDFMPHKFALAIAEHGTDAVCVVSGAIGENKQWLQITGPQAVSVRNLPERATDLIDLAVGMKLGQRGVFQMYKVGDALTLECQTLADEGFPNAVGSVGVTTYDYSPHSTFVPQVILDANFTYSCCTVTPGAAGGNGGSASSYPSSDVYVGCTTGLFMIGRGEWKKAQIVTKEIRDVREVVVREDARGIAVWVMCSPSDLYLISGRRQADGTIYFTSPMLFQSNVLHVSAQRNSKKLANQLFVVNTQLQVTHYWQDPTSSLWQSNVVKTKSGKYSLDQDSYTNRVTFFMKDGSALTKEARQGLSVSITCSEWCYVRCNGNVYSLDVDSPLVIAPDIQSAITVIFLVSSIDVPILHLSSDRFDNVVNIYPNAGVFRGLAKIQNGDDLKNAKDKTGKSVLPANAGSTTPLSDDTVGAVAASVQALVGEAHSQGLNSLTTYKFVSLTPKAQKASSAMYRQRSAAVAPVSASSPPPHGAASAAVAAPFVSGPDFAIGMVSRGGKLVRVADDEIPLLVYHGAPEHVARGSYRAAKTLRTLTPMRFPAPVRLAAAAGQPLPRAAADVAPAGGHAAPKPMHSIWDDIGDAFSDFAGDALHWLEHAGMDMISYLKEGVRYLRDGVSFVLHKVGEGLQFVINIGTKVLKLVLKTLAMVFKAVNWLFKLIGIDLTVIFKWLGHLLGWDEIWGAHKIIAKFITNGGNSMVKAVPLYAEKIGRPIVQQIGKFSQELRATLLPADVNNGSLSNLSGSHSSPLTDALGAIMKGLDAVSSFMPYQLLNGLLDGGDSSGLMDQISKAAQDFLDKVIVPALAQLGACLEKDFNDLIAFLQDPTKGTVGKLMTLVCDAVDTVLLPLQAMLNGVIDIAEEITKLLNGLLQLKGDFFPFIGAMYEFASDLLGEEEEFTLINGLSLVIALPLKTVMSLAGQSLTDINSKIGLDQPDFFEKLAAGSGAGGDPAAHALQAHGVHPLRDISASDATKKLYPVVSAVVGLFIGLVGNCIKTARICGSTPGPELAIVGLVLRATKIMISFPLQWTGPKGALRGTTWTLATVGHLAAAFAFFSIKDPEARTRAMDIIDFASTAVTFILCENADWGYDNPTEGRIANVLCNSSALAFQVILLPLGTIPKGPEAMIVCGGLVGVGAAGGILANVQAASPKTDFAVAIPGGSGGGH